MEQILLAYSLCKETVTAMVIFYKNMKAMVSSLDCDTNIFDIATGVFLGDKLAPCILIFYLDSVRK